MWTAVLLCACVAGLANYKTGTAKPDTGRIDTEQTEGPPPEADEPDSDDSSPSRKQVWLYTGSRWHRLRRPQREGGTGEHHKPLDKGWMVNLPAPHTA